MWKAIHGAVQGRSHKRENIPGQDRTCSYAGQNVFCAALADGAGSEPLSHIGAEQAVKAGAVYLCEHFDEFYESGEDKEIQVTKLIDCVRRQLAKTAAEHGLDNIGELSSTLLLAAVKEDKLVTVHIGDGVVAAIVKGKPVVLSGPKNGEYLNVTYFTTSKNVMEGTEIYCGLNRDIEAVVLMSDGSGDNFYDRHKNTLVPILAEIVQKLKHMQEAQAEVQLRGVLEYIAGQNTQDDCSLAVLVQE